MAMQDKCVRSMNSIHVTNKRLFVDIRLSVDDDMQLQEPASSANELSVRVRKPYTITKQRERWTEEEHEKFLEAIKLHGRAWRRIHEHIGTKTVIQIRSHAQKVFSKVVRDSGTENDIEIPPPRPKRKPLHPYPRKLLCTTRVLDMKQPGRCPLPNPAISEQESGSPVSVLSAVGSDTLGSSVSKPPNSCVSPLSSVVGSDPIELSLSEPENGCCSPTSSVGKDRKLSLGPASKVLNKLDESPLELDLASKDQISPGKGSPAEAQLTSLKLFGRTLLVTNSQKTCSSDDGIAPQCFKTVPSAGVGSHEEKIDMDKQNQAVSFTHFPAHEDLCGIAGRIPLDGAEPPIYCFSVPNSVQMNSTDEMIAPLPFLWVSCGSLAFPPTNQLNMSLKQGLPQAYAEAHTQMIAQSEGSLSDSSSASGWNENIMNDDNHIVVGSISSGLLKEPTLAFRLKPSEKSAFVSVKASNQKPARGFVPYEACKVGK